MKRFCKCTISVLAGAIAIAALSGCGSEETTDTAAGSAESEEIVTSVSSAAETSDTSGVSTEDTAADTAAVKTITPADSFAGGSGTEEDPYQIATAEQLARLGLVADSYYEDAVDYFDCYYVLTEDVYLNDTSDYDNWSETAPEYAWIPIDATSGVHLDGQDHTIYGMYINDASAQMYYDEDGNHSGDTSYEAGLFGTIYGGEIKNVNLDQAYIDVDSCSEVGTLIGSALDCTVTDFIVTAILRTGGQCYLGGIVGSQYGGEISSGSFKYGTIYVEEGTNNMTDIGGIAGYSSGSVIGCANEGAIENTSAEHVTIGGIVGSASSGLESVISGCDNKASLTGATPIGGIIGSFTGNTAMDSQDGALVSEEGILTVEDCYNDGSLTAVTGDGISYGVGGIIGSAVDFGENTFAMTGCVNYGSVTGEDYTGGIIGDMNNGGNSWSIENCTNKGAITGDTYVGGIIGYEERPGTDITVSGCSNEADVTAEEDCVGGIIGGITSIDLGTSDNAPTFTVEACTNSGKISSGDGISGTGGIVGGTVSGIETPMTLVISRCTNSGEVYASQSAHIGGILGGTEPAVANAVIDVQIVDCVNTGSIGLGDQSVAYADLSESDEETSTAEKVFLYLGGSCVGGIAGMAENTSIDNCVNSGSLLLDAAMYSDTIYVGSIVGQYRYTDGNDYADNIGVRNCSYSTPEDAYSPNNLTPEVLAEIITGMNRVSASEAEALAAEVIQ